MLRQLAGPSKTRKFNDCIKGAEKGEPCHECKTLLEKSSLTVCPDGIKTCLGCHYGWVCPNCLAEYTDEPILLPAEKIEDIVVLGPDDPKARTIGFIMTEKLGIGYTSKKG